LFKAYFVFYCQAAAGNIAKKLSLLRNGGDDLIASTSNATAAGLRSRESDLEQRLKAVGRTLTKLNTSLTATRDQRDVFKRYCSDIEAFLDEANSSLKYGSGTADDEAIGACIEEFTKLATQFVQKEASLETVNQLAYALPLSAESSDRVKRLNSRWQQLLADTKSQCRSLQKMLVSKQNFKEKCNDWLSFLNQVEKDLNVPLAGNYEALLKQKQNYETFENDLYSRQQTLFFILAEGREMMKDSQFAGNTELQSKLKRLDEQWQSIIEQTKRRRAGIMEAIAQWSKFHAQHALLQQRLLEAEESVESVDVLPYSLQWIKAQLYKYQVSSNFLYIKFVFLLINNK